MYQHEFSLQITSRETGQTVTYEKCSVCCEYRSQILEQASLLDGNVGPTSSLVTVPTDEKLHELVRYIEDLMHPESPKDSKDSKEFITITVRGKFFASLRKTSKMETFRESLLVQLSTYRGTETEDGFSFMNPYEASLFVKSVSANYLV
mgnify:CR=1 FL=1